MFTLLIAAFFSTCFLTWLVRHYALHRGVIDMPNARSSHAVPTPRGGGVSFVLMFSATLILLLSFEQFNPGIKSKILWSLLLGGGMTALIGFLDDHRHIPARWRFLTHLAAAIVALYLLDFSWNWLRLAFTAICLVWLLNLYNFMDGIDAIAACEAISVLTSAALISVLQSHDGAVMFLWLILAAGVGGFLIWNRPPATIFMGDAASGFLGLILGLFALISFQDGSLNFVCWPILLSCFIVDATYTLLYRMLRGDRWYEAHRSHTYQKLAARWQALLMEQGFDAEASRACAHRNVVAAMLAINALWLLPLAWAADAHPGYAALWLPAAWLPLMTIAAIMRAGAPE